MPDLRSIIESQEAPNRASFPVDGYKSKPIIFKVRSDGAYEAPIKILSRSIYDALGEQIKKDTDGVVMKAILDVGIKVDKDELIKALRYDRGQYDKGFSDGYAAGYTEALSQLFDSNTESSAAAYLKPSHSVYGSAAGLAYTDAAFYEISDYMGIHRPNLFPENYYGKDKENG